MLQRICKTFNIFFLQNYVIENVIKYYSNDIFNEFKCTDVANNVVKIDRIIRYEFGCSKLSDFGLNALCIT